MGEIRPRIRHVCWCDLATQGARVSTAMALTIDPCLSEYSNFDILRVESSSYWLLICLQVLLCAQVVTALLNYIIQQIITQGVTFDTSCADRGPVGFMFWNNNIHHLCRPVIQNECRAPDWYPCRRQPAIYPSNAQAGTRLNKNTVFPDIDISVIKIRQSCDYIFILKRSPGPRPSKQWDWNHHITGDNQRS